MRHQDLYDALCRALTDYEGYGTDDRDVIGDASYIIDELDPIIRCKDINPLTSKMAATIIESVDLNYDDGEKIYSLAVDMQNNWDDIWVGE